MKEKPQGSLAMATRKTEGGKKRDSQNAKGGKQERGSGSLSRAMGSRMLPPLISKTMPFMGTLESERRAGEVSSEGMEEGHEGERVWWSTYLQAQYSNVPLPLPIRVSLPCLWEEQVSKGPRPLDSPVRETTARAC